MRLAAALLGTTVFGALALHGEGYGPGLTILLDFQEAASAVSIGEMQREIRELLKPAGVQVDVRLTSDVRPDDTFQDLVVFRLKGSCAPITDPRLIDERGPGPLAFAHTSDGKILPFGEVACDSVRRAVESALWGGQRQNRDEMFGRALGRVVAHELVHMLGQTGTHGKSGVFKPSLSGAQLISDHLEFSPGEVDHLRHVNRTALR